MKKNEGNPAVVTLRIPVAVRPDNLEPSERKRCVIRAVVVFRMQIQWLRTLPLPPVDTCTSILGLSMSDCFQTPMLIPVRSRSIPPHCRVRPGWSTDRNNYHSHLAQGMIDVAFDPGWEDNSFFYVSYTVDSGTVDDSGNVSVTRHVGPHPPTESDCAGTALWYQNAGYAVVQRRDALLPLSVETLLSHIHANRKRTELASKQLLPLLFHSVIHLHGATSTPLPHLVSAIRDVTRPAPGLHHHQALALNRVSRFTWTEGDPTATRESELVVLDTGIKRTTIHSAGWLGFKPSAYGQGVRNERQARDATFCGFPTPCGLCHRCVECVFRCTLIHVRSLCFIRSYGRPSHFASATLASRLPRTRLDSPSACQRFAGGT